MRNIIILLLVILLTISIAASEKYNSNTPSVLSIDNSQYINANKILMFVTNHGNFGRDLGGVFGHDYGTYYPYVDHQSIIDGSLDKSVNYASGLWLGGKVNNSIRVATSEYDSDFVPGPMENGTFMTDRPEFRVYKLYSDSLKNNPNQDYIDYLNYAIDMGAPFEIDPFGDTIPEMRGRQMLWSIYNDADPDAHIAFQSLPLGIEVRQTVWASDEDGNDSIPLQYFIPLTSTTSDTMATIYITNRYELTGHEYEITRGEDSIIGRHWSLTDKTLGTTLVDKMQFDSGNSYEGDGLKLFVANPTYIISSFQTIANGNGVIDPPVSAALASQNFPTPGNLDPSFEQQAGPARWAIHTGDNGGTNGGGNRGSYAAFMSRTIREDSFRMYNMAGYNWEMRFTGSNSNPGVGGGYAITAFTSGRALWVPFELWRIDNTDSNKQLRLIPWLFDDGGDSLFYLSSYGSDADGNCGPKGCEHSASGGDDDPYTDWIYWRIPVDATTHQPAESGTVDYDIFEAAAIANPAMPAWEYNELAVMDRTVLINLDAGVQPPFTQDMPEQGTVFRLTTHYQLPDDTATFTANPIPVITSGAEGMSIYIQYELFNKGINSIDSCYVALWSDPDLGSSGDDLVGCDTLSNIGFCYNGIWGNPDNVYGFNQPAMGYKLLYGPLIPSQGQTARFNNILVDNFKNLPMTAYHKFVGGDDPDSFQEAFMMMAGWDHKANIRYTYDGNELNYWQSGDPVTGLGDLDCCSADKRMALSTGPFTFNPGDSQYVLIKFAVGQGNDWAESITRMKEILNLPYNIPVGVDDDKPKNLPRQFSLSQNYPNPFNPSTMINYSLPIKSNVKLEIFNILGQRVKTLVDLKQPAGSYQIEWDGNGDNGEAVATGIYLYKLTADKFERSKKMILIK